MELTEHDIRLMWRKSRECRECGDPWTFRPDGGKPICHYCWAALHPPPPPLPPQMDLFESESSDA